MRDPLGFERMEDLIPFAQRYDRDGMAIPFPTGVCNDCKGGTLEYKCTTAGGCPVMMEELGHWVPFPNGKKFSKGERIIALSESGGMARVDNYKHGSDTLFGYVKTSGL